LRIPVAMVSVLDRSRNSRAWGSDGLKPTQNAV
jgi:hypothetical protein